MVTTLSHVPACVPESSYVFHQLVMDRYKFNVTARSELADFASLKR